MSHALVSSQFSPTRSIKRPATDDLARAEKYMRASTSANTRRAYTQHWRQFTEYCARRRRAALPADARTVCAYLAVAADAGRRPSTIGQAVAAITFVHRLAKHTLPSAYPEVRTLLQGIRRTVGTEQRQMRPLLLDDMHQMMATLEGCGLRDVRDRAVILLSWSLMLRRSELCALDVRDVELRRGCVVVTIRRSKTDQAGQGISKSVARLPVDHASVCPARAVQAWLEVMLLKSGPLFRRLDGGVLRSERMSDQAVYRLVKRLAAEVGIDPGQISPHSALRAGPTTALVMAGVPTHLVARMGRWKTAAMVDQYARPGQGEEMAAMARALGAVKP